MPNASVWSTCEDCVKPCVNDVLRLCGKRVVFGFLSILCASFLAPLVCLNLCLESLGMTTWHDSCPDVLVSLSGSLGGLSQGDALLAFLVQATGLLHLSADISTLHLSALL